MPHSSNTTPPTGNAPNALLRLELRDGPHRWSLAFTVDDADRMADRIDELARDPHAPIEPATARLLRDLILREASAANLPQTRSENADHKP
jgi:hypothetical protein